MNNKQDLSAEHLDFLKLRFKTLNNSNTSYNVDVLLETVSEFTQNSVTFDPQLFQKYDSKLLLEILEISHKFYLRKVLPETELSLSQLIKNSYSKNDLAQYVFVDKAFKNYKTHIEKHILYEEKYIFPYIKQLLIGNHELDRVSPHYNSLADFYINHSDVGADLKSIIMILKSNSSNPLNGALILKLEHFYYDLLIHDKIEEEILIPRMLKLEND